MIAWRVGRPHLAWQILAESGLQSHWREFQKEAFTRARRGYIRAMARYVQ